MQNGVRSEKRWLYRMTATFMGVATLAMIAAFFLLLNVNDAIDASPRDKSVISVTGTAETMAEPDVANINFVVREEGKTQAEAQDAVSKKVKAINDMLDDEDVDDKDIQTTNVSVSPVYKYVHETTGALCGGHGKSYCPRPYNRTQTGFQVSQSTRVKVRDIDDAGSIVAKLSDEGVENLYGPNLEVENYEDIVEEVKLEAIEDAREKAKARAKALGLKLGDVLNVSEGGFYPIPYDGRGGGGIAVMESAAVDASFKAEETQINVGENEIRASITVTYELK